MNLPFFITGLVVGALGVVDIIGAPSLWDGYAIAGVGIILLLIGIFKSKS